MLGDADGNGAGGFAVLDAKTFEVKGRWENGGETPHLNYDFWYQPRATTLMLIRVRRAEGYEPGFDLEDVKAGHYGSRLHFWNLAERSLPSRRSISARRGWSFRGAFAPIPTRKRASSAPRSSTMALPP